MKVLKWSFIYTRDSQPLAAFCDLALAEAYVMKAPEMNEQIVSRNFVLGNESAAVRENKVLRHLLREIVQNDFTIEGDRALAMAIIEAKHILKI